MFEYCERSAGSIATTIGTFLSHNVNWKNDDNSLISVEEVNSWDRELIAKRYLYEYFCPEKYDSTLEAIGGEKNKNKFIKEVSIKIDEFIPKRYFIKYNQLNSKKGHIDGGFLSSQFKGKDEHEITKNLVYIYEENYDKKTPSYTPSEKPVTDKQLSYLSYLAEDGGYTIINFHDMTSSKASELISFLLGKGDEPLDMFRYLTFE